MLCHTAICLFLLPLSLFLISKGVVSLQSNCSWSIDARTGKDILERCYILLDTDISDAHTLTDSPYDPGDWIPESLRPPGSWPQPFVLSNVIFQLTFCEPVWKIAEKACTFRLSSTWPSAGLQAGPGFIFFGKIVSQAVVADRLNVTCPLSDWARLLESRGQGSNSSGVDYSPPLAPCGTATVFTGRQLVEALEQLQQGHARVMLNLAANVSLPADPTPQRELNAFDDSHPLVQIYRNVTLAAPMTESGALTDEYGFRKGAMVELDVRKRRNAFQITKAPDQEGQPVLVFADMNVVNVPPGPPSSWPIGLLSIFQYTIGLNRSGMTGVQLIGLRSKMVMTTEETGYMNYWFIRTISILASERASAAWLYDLMGLLKSVPDVDGSPTRLIGVSDYLKMYNCSIAAVPFLTAPTPNDFDLWSPEGSALPSAATQKQPPLPPTSFAVAQEARTLLQLLLQAPWNGSSTRAILLLNNMTLVPREWPERGITIPYNLSLVGPAMGDPVWLDTAGLPLLAASSNSGGSSAAGAQPPAPVNVLQLHRVRLVGFTPPLLTASTADIAEAEEGGAFMAGPELKEWRDSCLQRDLVSSVADSVGSTSTATTTAATTTATRPLLPWRHDLKNCVIEMPRSLVQLLWFYNFPSRCAAAVDDEATALGTAGRSSRALCDIIWGDGGQVPFQLPASLQKLLSVMLTMAPSNDNVSNVRAMLGLDTESIVPGHFTNATMAGGAITLYQSTIMIIEEASTPADDHDSSSDNLTISHQQEACGAASFIVAIQASYSRLSPPAAAVVPDSNTPDTRNHTSKAAAIIGGSLGGFTVLLLIGAIIVMVLRTRKWERREQAAHLSLTDTGNDQDHMKVATIGIRIADVENCDGGATGGPSPRGHPPQEVCLPLDPAGRANPDTGLNTTPSMIGGDHGIGIDGSSSGYLGFSVSFLRAQGGNMAGGDVGESAATRRIEPRETMADILLPAAAICKTAQAGQTTALSFDMITTMQGEIENILLKCKAVVSQNANSSSTSSGMSRRMVQLLGRGAHGSVYKGVWRGLPAAVKVMIVHAGDSEERRQRLAREAALTSALSHPNIVPTYHYEMEVVREAGPYIREQAAMEGEEGAGIVALRMRLVMQYCEGGTLQEALKDGKFGETVATLLKKKGRAQGIHPRSQHGMLREQQPASAVAAAAAACTDGGSVETISTTVSGAPEVNSAVPTAQPLQAGGVCSPGLAAPNPGAHQNRLLAGEVDTEDTKATMSPWMKERLEWLDLIPAANMPLSLLAALDILRGLEYLHGHGVIHGDLTENNVLLKAVQPIVSSSKLTVSSPSEKLAATLLGAAETAARYYDGTGRTDKHTDTSRFSSDSTTLGEPSRLYQAPLSASTNPTDTPTLAPTLRLPPQMGLPCRMEENKVGRVTHGTHEQSATGQRQANNNSAFASVQQQGMDTSSNTAGPLSDGPTSSVLATRRSQHEGSSSLGQPVSPNQDELMKQGPSRARAWLRQIAANSDCSVAQTRAAKSTQSEKPFTTGANKVPVAYRRSLDENSNREGQTPGILSTGSLSGRGSSQAAGGIAAQMLAWAFKISDFGLAAEIHGQSQSHLSNMAQGTPFFAAPEVVHLGRLSPAADIYSFGVLMWLLLHGVALIQLRHLLPRMPHVPIGDLLLFNTCTTLPVAARELLGQCLASEPARRPTVKSLVRVLEQLLRDVAGPELSQILLSVERREQHVWAPEQAEAVGGR